MTKKTCAMLAFFIIVKKKKKKKAIVFAKSFVPCNRLCHAISTAAYEHLEFSDSFYCPGVFRMQLLH